MMVLASVDSGAATVTTTVSVLASVGFQTGLSKIT